MHVRDATEVDAARMVEIYNEEMFTSTGIWSDRAQTLEERVAWFAARTERGFPTVVAEEGGEVVGVAAFGDFRDSLRWSGYRFTVEHSVHVLKRSWGCGAGSALMHALFVHAKARGIHVMIGGVDGFNTRSMAFHERLGFRELGRLPETGWVHERWCDLVLMQKFIDAPGALVHGGLAPAAR